MSSVENLQINGTSYPIRDKNTLRSLTPEQRTTLETLGSYNGVPVIADEVFLETTGKFVLDTVTPVEDAVNYYNVASTIPYNMPSGGAARICCFDNGDDIKRIVFWGSTSSGGVFYYSDDNGATFTQGSGSVSGLGNTNGSRFFTTSKAILMVLLSNLAVCGRSTNGITFADNPITLPETATTTRMLVFEDKFYVFDNAGWYICSSDGTTWSNKQTFPSVSSISNIVSNLDAIYIFADNKVYKSEDGETWDEGNSSNYYGVISACGHKIFCEQLGKHGQSSNGVSFTEVSGDLFGGWNRVGCTYWFVNATYFAGYGYQYRTSLDGATWASAKQLVYESGGSTIYVSCFGTRASTTGQDAANAVECDNYLCGLGFYGSSNPNIVNINVGTSYVSTLTDLSGTGTSASAPTDDVTVGYLGQIYIDTINKDAYICVESDDSNSTYTWKQITLESL